MVGRTTSSAWIQGVAEMLEGIGLDGTDVLTEAGIDPSALADPAHRTSTEQISRLWRVAAEKSGNPAISLACPHVPKPGNFDIVAYAMLSSQTLRIALQNFRRHLRLVSEAASIELYSVADPETYRLEFKLNGGAEPIPRQRVEFNLLTMVTFCRWVSGRELNPRSVFFVWPAPPDISAFQEAFRCPVIFQADFNGIDFFVSDIDARLPGHNPSVWGLHDKLVERRIAAFDGAKISTKARDEIARRLVGGEPRREEVARSLHVSDSTLARRLREERVSFQQLLDETRAELAQVYLAEEKKSLAEVAFLLGFGDQSAFFRACKRWFNAPPGRVRNRLSATQAHHAGKQHDP